MNKNLLISLGVLILLAAAGAVFYAQTRPQEEVATDSPPIETSPILDQATSSEAISQPPPAVETGVDVRIRASAVRRAKPAKTAEKIPTQPTRFYLTNGSRAAFAVQGSRSLIGTSDGIIGDILIDWSKPSKSVFSPIGMSAQMLETEDIGLRAVQLASRAPGDEDMVFAPASVTGWPGRITPGKPITLTASGTLTIGGVTRPATFKGVLTPSARSLAGTLSATILRTDYEIDYANPDNENVLTLTLQIVGKTQ